MSHFQRGHSVVGPVSPASIEHYGELVPLELERAWREEGQLMTSDGFVRAIDPALVLPVMGTILPVLPGAIPLFSTAWGDLVVYHEDILYFVYYRIGVYRVVADPFSGLIFDQLEDDAMQRDFFVRSFYDQAVAALGVPEINECFGFVLPLSLGGAPDVSNVARRKLREHLVFLVQTGGPPRALDEIDRPGEPSRDRSTAAPSPQPTALIDRGRQLLRKLDPNAAPDFEVLPQDRAVYLWQTGFGGGQLIIGEDGSVLYGNSSLSRDPMIDAWRTGKRTPPEQFETAGPSR